MTACHLEDLSAGEEVEDGVENLRVLGGGEIAMVALVNGEKFGIVAIFNEFFGDVNAVLVGYDGVGIAMDGHDGRKFFTNPGVGRNAASNFLLVGKRRGDPGGSVAAHVFAFELILDVGDAIEVDDGGDIGGRAEFGLLGSEADHESEMTTGGIARDHDAAPVNVVAGGVVAHPSGSQKNIFHGGGRESGGSETIFHIGDNEAFFEVGQAVPLEHIFFFATDPATTMDDDNGRAARRSGRTTGLVNVENCLRMTRVRDVCFDAHPVGQHGLARQKGRKERQEQAELHRSQYILG